MYRSCVLLISLSVSLLASCSLSGKTVSFEVKGDSSSGIYVVPEPTARYGSVVSVKPVRPAFYPPGVGAVIYSSNVGFGSEPSPPDVFKTLTLYHNAVLLKSIEVKDGTFYRTELQYPFYPAQVHQIFQPTLTAEEQERLTSLPLNGGYSVVEIDATTKKVSWKPLVTKLGDSIGVKYRCLIEVSGASFLPPTELLDSDRDSLSATFSALLPNTRYDVKVFFGDLKGHLGSYPTFSLPTP